jgi:hypothetical protein
MVIILKWPKTIGDRDRTKQYDSYVKPLCAEEKIVLTQKAHMRSQKELMKASICVERAINHYFKARYGAKEVISKLDGLRQEMQLMQEEIKKITMNSLPYKDLNEERINERTFMVSLPKISKKAFMYICASVFNIIVYLCGLLLSQSWFFAGGFLISAVIFLSLYVPWSRKTEKTLATSKKIGPKIW